MAGIGITACLMSKTAALFEYLPDIANYMPLFYETIDFICQSTVYIPKNRFYF
jgi:hypothetical protein